MIDEHEFLRAEEGVQRHELGPCLRNIENVARNRTPTALKYDERPLQDFVAPAAAPIGRRAVMLGGGGHP